MRILANYGLKANGDMYSVTFETMGDVPAAHAPQTVDELFRLAKEAVQRQLGHTSPHVTPQPVAVTIPQPVLSRVEGPVTNRVEPPPAAAQPISTNGHGKKPQIKDPAQPASAKQIHLLKRLAQEKGQWIHNVTDLTMGEASAKIEELMAR